MVDWKRTEKDLTSSAGARFKRYGTGPCQGILDSNFNKYMVQQNLYSCILGSILEDFTTLEKRWHDETNQERKKEMHQ